MKIKKSENYITFSARAQIFFKFFKKKEIEKKSLSFNFYRLFHGFFYICCLIIDLFADLKLFEY